MVAPALRTGQFDYEIVNTVVTSLGVTLPSSPVAGNVMIVVAGAKDSQPADFVAPSGFAAIGIPVASTGSSNTATAAFYRAVQPGDGATHSVGLNTGGQRMWVAIFEFEGDWDTPSVLSSSSATSGTATSFAGTPATGSALTYGVSVRTDSGGFDTQILSMTVVGSSSVTNISGLAGYRPNAGLVEDVTWTSSKQHSGLVVELPEGEASAAVILGAFDASPTFYPLGVYPPVTSIYLNSSPTFFSGTVNTTPGTVVNTFLEVSPVFYEPSVAEIPLSVALTRFNAYPTFYEPTIAEGFFARASSAAALSGSAGVLYTSTSGSAVSASGFSGALGISSGSPNGGTFWSFSDGLDTYVLNPGPSDVQTPTQSDKRILYQSRTLDNKNLVYMAKGDRVEITLSGTHLTQSQVEEFETWAKRRTPWIVKDDLEREWLVTCRTYSPRRVHKPYNPWYHTYTMVLLVESFTG